MSSRTNQIGFTLVEILLVFLVVGLLGFIGYNFYTHQTQTADNTVVSPPVASNSVPTAPEINSVSDLDKASATLDQTDTASTNDSIQLDSQLQAF